MASSKMPKRRKYSDGGASHASEGATYLGVNRDSDVLRSMARNTRWTSTLSGTRKKLAGVATIGMRRC